MAADLSLHIEIEPGVEALIRRAALAFEQHDLDEPLTRLRDLLDAGTMLDVASTGQQSGTPKLCVTLKPFVELALRDAIEIATRPYDGATKMARIREMWTLAGLSPRTA